jgi:ABC-type branched-subunit amino acid transport system substrate-binding protein
MKFVSRSATCSRATAIEVAVAAALALGGMGCVTPPEHASPNHAVRVGALLPFTGELGASGANIERTLLWVVEQVNAAGGIGDGREIELVTRDSGADVAQGLAVARELVEQKQVTAIIGPEHDDLAAALLPYLVSKGVFLISGGVTSTTFSNQDSNGLWFRTMPSSRSFAAVMAARIYAAGLRSLAILFVDDVFGNDMAEHVQSEFIANGGTVVARLPFASGARSHSEVVVRLGGVAPEAVALISYPKDGASIQQEWASTGAHSRWYFSHTLHGSAFIENAPQVTVEGMEGVAPAVSPNDESLFASMFASRWPGDAPLPAAYFNYDALALFALASAQAAAEVGPAASTAELSQCLFRVSYSSTGKRVSWSDLAAGLALVRAHSAIDYRGASGSVDWRDSTGNVPDGQVQLWSVRNAAIVNGEIVPAAPLSK